MREFFGRLFMLRSGAAISMGAKSGPVKGVPEQRGIVGSAFNR
jgi:hypothetical protein